VRRPAGTLSALVGTGHKIALFTLPVVVAGVIADVVDPSLFDMGVPPSGLRIASLMVLVAGVTIWAWSVILILTEVPRGELITTGPYAVVKHPLYTSVALLVLPSLGVLFGSWLWVLAGAVLYVGSRLFAPEEEDELAQRFGARWVRYRQRVWIPWL
jgi:protein-S-isoprenylcysteine O-methyltransferase Ste14